MLVGVDPILNGKLLLALDEMGHGDAVVIADAHFTASKLARKHLVDLPGLPSPRVLRAIRSVFVPDDYRDDQLVLMRGPDDNRLPVQDELVAEARVAEEHVSWLERFDFYDLAATAELVIRTGEVRTYGNAVFFKGVTPVPEAQS
ncbi:MAG: hypothetical protein LBR32_09205 [Propionibacteriaceae bacterium]|nr:hypothetical protein [Propionibacteriaceae bacterium]